MIGGLFILGVGSNASDLCAFELYPAFLFLVVLEDRLHLDHLLEAHDHLGWEPTLHTSLKAK